MIIETTGIKSAAHIRDIEFRAMDMLSTPELYLRAEIDLFRTSHVNILKQLQLFDSITSLWRGMKNVI